MQAAEVCRQEAGSIWVVGVGEQAYLLGPYYIVSTLRKFRAQEQAEAEQEILG